MSPIVLLHGLGGFGRVQVGPVRIDYFRRIERALEARGHPLLAPGVNPIASIARRAEQARGAILSWLAAPECRGQRLIILAHSMGGLDARLMISQMGLAEHVAALVTIATPHRGSTLADFWVENPPMQRVGLPVLQYLGLDAKGGPDLTTSAMREFNESVKDAPGVRYFSVDAVCPSDRVPLPLQLGYQIIRRREGENDGMVSRASARWGEHLETWPVHHLHAVNHRFPVDAKSPVGDITPLYLRVVERVEKEAS